MAETAEIIENEVIAAPSPFSVDAWKMEPSQAVQQAPEAETPEAIIEENTATPIEETASITEEKKVEPTIIEPEPIKFANEESEKVFNLLKEGKIDDVYAIISEQKKLATVDKLPPADIIKLNLQYQHKDFTPQEINDLFEDTYSMPEKPVQSISEDDDDFKAREDKYNAQLEKIENRIKRDAKPATAELLKLSKEIVLPDIQKQQALVNEPTQEELDVLKAKSDLFLKKAAEELNALQGYKVTYKDEEVEIPVAYNLTKDEKSKIQPLIELSHSNGIEFLKSIGWLDEAGELVASKLAEDLPFIINKEAVLQKMVTETGVLRYAAAKKSIKNIDYSGGKTGGGEVGASPEQIQKKWVTGFFSR